MAASGWRLAGLWPWWLLLACELAAVAAAAASYALGYRRLSRSRRVLLLFLRWLWVQAVVLAALRPIMEAVEPVRDVPSLILMVDTSASMAESDELGKSRLDAASEAIAAVWPELEAAGTRFLTMLARFDADVRGVPAPAEIGPAIGASSRLDLALRWTIERAGLPALGVVLFTDGAADSYLDTIQEAERLKSMRLPVYPVLLGASQSGPETWIEAVDVPEVTTVRQAQPVTVKLAYNLPVPGAPTAQLVMLEDGAREVAVAPITYYELGGSTEAAVNYRPLTPGYHWLEFRLEPLAGERRTDNNYVVRLVRAVAEDVAAVAFSRGFSFDLGLLTRALRAAGIAVHTYALPGQQPGFGTAQRFAEAFDVAVAEAAGLAALSQAHLEPLCDFIRQGGGLVLLAGPDWQAIPREPLATLFGGDLGASIERSAVGWLVAPADGAGGGVHVLSPRPAENRNLWARMGPLHYRYAVDVALLADVGSPLRFTDGKPFVVSGRLGRGRVALVLGGPLHVWALAAAPAGIWGRFAGRLVRSVCPGERQAKAIDAGPERLLYKAGEEVVVHLRAAEPMEADVQVRTREPAGAPAFWQRQVTVGREGAQVSLGTGLPAGGYRLSVEAAGETAGTGFVVAPVDDEAARTLPEHGLLEYLATHTGGRCVRGAKGAVQIIRELAGQPAPPVRYVRKEVPVFPFFVYLAAFLFAAAGEWYLRRRWGLV